MTPRPHETPEFRNAVTYTVAITYTVRGGARHGTADRRATKIAERLTNNAARATDVLEASATAGRNCHGEVVAAEPVRFSAANSGRGTYREPDKLDRYIDPDHERAWESLEATNAAHRAHQKADRDRRVVVGCRNAYRASAYSERGECLCVYCEPDDHAAALGLVGQSVFTRFHSYRCVCGKPVAMPRQRCVLHRDVALIGLDGDPGVLQALLEERQREHHS